MTPRDFAQLWFDEKAFLVSAFLDESSQSAAAVAVSQLGLSPEQIQGLKTVLDLAIADTMYTLLLGLDGCASIAGRQEIYRLCTSSGEQLTGHGALEEAAWQVFHGTPKESS